MVLGDTNDRSTNCQKYSTHNNILDASLQTLFKDDKIDIDSNNNYIIDEEDPVDPPKDYITPSFEPLVSEATIFEAVDMNAEACDQYINAQVLLPNGVQ